MRQGQLPLIHTIWKRGHSRLMQTNWTNTRIKVISFKGLGSGFQIRQADPITGSIPFISDLTPAFPLRFLSDNFKQCACPRPIRPEHHHHKFIHQREHLDQVNISIDINRFQHQHQVSACQVLSCQGHIMQVSI